MAEMKSYDLNVLPPEKMAVAKVLAAKIVGVLVGLFVWLAVFGIPSLALYVVGGAVGWFEDALSAPLQWLMNIAKRLKGEADTLIAEARAARAAKASAEAN